MKIVSWNVNSIRVRMDQVLDWLDRNRPTALCLQEIKIETDKFPVEPFKQRGYNVAINGQKAYHGVATISREPMESIRKGLGDDDLDAQARLIAGKVGDVTVINVYAPNGETPTSPKFQFKRRWYKALHAMLQQDFSPDQPLLICGDFNIAPADIDVYDPDAWRGQCLFHPDEHAWLRKLMDWGLVDGVRLHHPEAGLYSWWDYRTNAFSRNNGLRIDHFLVTKPLAARCTGSRIDVAMRGAEQPSDHAPVEIEFKS